MRMRKCIPLVVLLSFLGLQGLYSQQASISDYLAECEKKYGSDADLVNGEKYFYPYRHAKGDPFFYTEPRPAHIRIKEKDFEGELLRYDLLNQHLVLDFQDLYGATTSLVLRNEWVESFSFGQIQFRREKGPEGEPEFFQVLIDGPVSCFYRWSKLFQLNLTSGEQGYYFTDLSKESFLLMDDQFHQFRSNRSFAKAFEKELQRPIKLFMRQLKMNVKNASDSKMRQLIEYCNSLSYEDS